MKTGIVIGILSGIITIALVVLIILLNFILPLNRQLTSAGEPDTSDITLPGSQIASITPEQTMSASINPSSPAINGPGPSPSPSNTLIGKDVNFLLDITAAEVIGLNSAIVEAQLTNSGTSTAHHTTATVEIICQNKRVPINGQDSLLVNIGDLAPGESRQIQLKTEVGLSDALRIKQAGATVRLTVISDEKRQVFTYDYVP